MTTDQATTGISSEPIPKRKRARNPLNNLKVDFSWAPESSKIATRVLKNFGRAHSLVLFYKLLKQSKGRSPTHAADMLRAAVVLIHAMLEDGLRSLLRHRLPRNKETFETIGLVGLNEHGRSEKFNLGELCRFKGQTIESVLEESLEAYLQKQSFNNRADVCRVLKLFEIDSSDFDKELTLISAMIARRHRIVHNADIDESKGAGHHFTTSINANEVQAWNDATRVLLSKLCGAYSGVEYQRYTSKPIGVPST